MFIVSLTSKVTTDTRLYQNYKLLIGFKQQLTIMSCCNFRHTSLKYYNITQWNMIQKCVCVCVCIWMCLHVCVCVCVCLCGLSMRFSFFEARHWHRFLIIYTGRKYCSYEDSNRWYATRTMLLPTELSEISGFESSQNTVLRSLIC